MSDAGVSGTNVAPTVSRRLLPFVSSSGFSLCCAMSFAFNTPGDVAKLITRVTSNSPSSTSMKG